MREILTVQIGSLANFVGSHFWNFQDEMLGLASDSSSDPVFQNFHSSVDMNVLYRSGETYQGILTCAPRLLSVGHQGSLGSMSSLSSLYHDSSIKPSQTNTWSCDISVIETPRRNRNLFLQRLHEEEKETHDLPREGEPNDEDIVEDLEKTVEFWTDYSKLHYHPRSLHELNQLSMDSEGERGEEMAENLRFFAEECDHIQGFQFIYGDSGEFTSLAANIMEHVSDEYPKSPLFLYNVMDTNARRSNPESLNDAVSLSTFSSFCNLITPIGLPFLSRSTVSKYLKIDDSKLYHCSAVYASALYSATLPFRFNPAGPTGNNRYASVGTDMRYIEEMLTGQGRRNIVTILDLALPPPFITDQSFVKCVHTLTPDISETEDSEAIESMAVQGALKEGGGYATVDEVMSVVNKAYEAMGKFWYVSVACCPLPIPLPYPQIFSEDIESVAIATRLRSSSAVSPFVERRLKDFSRLKKWNYGVHESDEIEENLCKMLDIFYHSHCSSSDSD